MGVKQVGIKLVRKDKLPLFFNEMKSITFPKSEEKRVLRILKEEGLITTTRTAKDFFRLKLNYSYKFKNLKLKIIKIKTYERISDHPFYRLLTKHMRESIKLGKRYSGKKYKVIWLKVENK